MSNVTFDLVTDVFSKSIYHQLLIECVYGDEYISDEVDLSVERVRTST